MVLYKTKNIKDRDEGSDKVQFMKCAFIYISVEFPHVLCKQPISFFNTFFEKDISEVRHKDCVHVE